VAGSKFHSRYLFPGLLICALGLSSPILAQDKGSDKGKDAPAGPKIEWVKGPAKVKIGDQAELNLPEGYMFADRENTRRVLEATHNIPNGRELGTVAPADDDWLVFYEFEDVGYVKDDDKDKLDADALLKSVTQGTEAMNEERKKRGWGEFHITGWLEKPHYDTQTHNLSWSIVGKNEKGQQSANYHSRVLGRRGVMTVDLVVDPEQLQAALPGFRKASVDPFAFNADSNYRAFVKGDKVAEYGLAALILGGAAAAASKTGLFSGLFKLLAAFWKIIVLAFVAAFKWIKQAVSSIFSRKKPQQYPGSEF
jgi:uncharacterized membrane-anchored protein